MLNLRCFLGPLLLLTIAFPSVAHADPEGQESPPRVEWYGWETLLADAAATGLAGLGLASDSGTTGYALYYSGFGAFALGAPIVHAARGRWGIASADLGVRVGGVATGAFVGFVLANVYHPPFCAVAASGPSSQFSTSTTSGGCPSSSSEGIAVGMIAGAIASSVIDASVFARAPTPAPSSSTMGLEWSPTLAPTRDGAVVGAAGRF